MCRMRILDERSDDANSIKCSKRDGRRTWKILGLLAVASRRWGTEQDQSSKNLESGLQPFRQQGPTYSSRPRSGQKPLENAGIHSTSVPLQQGQSGFLKREAFKALCIWIQGPEASLGEVSATPGFPPGLLFDFHLILHFYLILHYRDFWKSRSPTKGKGSPPPPKKKQLSCFLKTLKICSLGIFQVGDHIYVPRG